jgi:hypothetical protein
MHGPFQFFGMCQCSLCRKVTGSALATNLFVNLEGFSWVSGESNVAEYSLPAPSKFGNSFCKTCGSRVPKVSSERNSALIPLGSTMQIPEIDVTLVCLDDQVDWFPDLESALAKEAKI